MAETIGSAVIEVTADASGLSAGIASATQAVKSFESAATGSGTRAGAAISKANKDAAASAGQLSREQERLITSIERYSSTIGKSRGEILEYRAAQAGITTQVQSQISAIKAQEAALRGSNTQLGQTGLSAKQTAAALRGVPAQLTDIVTSLQGGQAPLTVLLQQGGQLKDMFGGIVPAAKALGGVLLGLINPYTVVAAAAAGLAYAYAQGSKENDEYVKALVLTGNIAGTTAAQMQLMAQNIDAVVGTQSQAAEALAAISATGQVAGTDLEKFGATAVRINRTVGTSIEDTAKQFAELGKDPVKASEKLNESMNYLTLAVYDQIKAAQENGREQEAASIAQNAYSDAMDKRTARLEANLGSIQRAWRAVTDVAREAWDEILGIGRPEGPGSNASPWKATGLLAALGGPLGAPLTAGLAGSNIRSGLGNLFTSDAEANAAAETQRLIKRSETGRAELDRQQAITNKLQIDARKRLDDQKKATRSRAEQRADEIKSFERDAKLVSLGADEYSKGLARINEKYKDPKGAAPKAFQEDAGSKMLETARQQGAALEAQLGSLGKMTEAEKELAKFNQLIADLKGRDQLTADQKQILAAEEKNRAQREVNVQLEREIGFQKILTDDAKRRADALKATENAADGVRRSLADMALQQGEQYNDRLNVVGLGSEAAEQQRSREQIERQYSRLQRQFTEEAARNKTLESDAYKKTTEDIATALAKAKAANSEYYANIKAQQSDWLLGAQEGLANYGSEAANAFKQTQDAVTRAFSGMEEALVNFVKTGKLDFKSLVDSIIADIARIIIKQQITGPLSGLLSRALGGLGGSSSLTGDSSTDLLTGLMGGSSGLSITGGGGGGGGLGSWLSGLLGFADGGSPPVGRPSIVGERGPELFVPKTAGTIIPNDALMNRGSGEPAVNVVINNTVGDVATLSMLKEAQAGTERRIAASIGRSRRYAGELS